VRDHGRENANKCCRGCLTEPASELDLAWSGYVETVERLVAAVSSNTDHHGLNVRFAVRELDSRISDAIMHAMEDGPRLEEKVSESLHAVNNLRRVGYQSVNGLLITSVRARGFLCNSNVCVFESRNLTVWNFLNILAKNTSY